MIPFNNTNIYSVAWSPQSNETLLIGGIGQDNGTFALYNFSGNSTTEINNLKTLSVAFSNNGNYLLQGS